MSKHEFLNGTIEYLRLKHARKNVQLWVSFGDKMVYFGLYIWGFCTHWHFGSSADSDARVREASRNSEMVHLVYKGMPA